MCATSTINGSQLILVNSIVVQEGNKWSYHVKGYTGFIEKYFIMAVCSRLKVIDDIFATPVEMSPFKNDSGYSTLLWHFTFSLSMQRTENQYVSLSV